MISEGAHHRFGEPSSGPSDEASSFTLDGDQRRGIERRADPRARTLVAGKIVIGDNLADCVVRNLSIGGAQVRVLGDVQAPITLKLLMPSEGLLFDATVVWRNQDKLGLAFRGHHDLDPTSSGEGAHSRGR